MRGRAVAHPPTAPGAAIITMRKVGYGDITPKATEGKIIAVVVMLIGYSVVSRPQWAVPV